MLHLCERRATRPKPKVGPAEGEIIAGASGPLKPAVDQPVWPTLCRQVKTNTKEKNAKRMQHQELQSVGFVKRLNYLRLTGNLPIELNEVY